jgi:hypothetical protein
MPAVDRGVDRLLHRTQQHGVDLLRVGPLLGGLGDLLEFTGLRVVTERHAHADRLEVVAQDLFLLRRRPFVHPEQARVFALRNEVGTADVRRQHGFFDQAVRLVARARNDLFDAPALVADDLGLGGFEVHRATHGARCEQRAVDIVQVQQVVDALLAPHGFGTPRVGQDRGHLGVGETGMAEHDRRIELVGVDLAGRIDQHVADHAQPLHFRVQGTQPVRQLLGQHRNDAAREVDRGGPVIRIHIDGTARLHVMADVRDRHQQPPAFGPPDAGRLAIDGVVKIARVFAVDRDQGNVGQVHAVLLVLGTYLVRQRPRLGNAGIRELVRHAVFAHRNLDLHAGIVDLAQHLLDPAHGLPEQGGRLGQFDHHHLPRLAGAGGGLGNHHILAVALVFGGHDPDAALVQQAPNDGMSRALDDLQHAAFRAPLAILPGDPHADLILVQHGAHLVWRQVDVGAAVVADQEAVSVAMSLNGSFDFIQQTAGGVGIFDI